MSICLRKERLWQMLTTLALHKSRVVFFFLIALFYCGQQLGLTAVSLGKSKLKQNYISRNCFWCDAVEPVIFITAGNKYS